MGSQKLPAWPPPKWRRCWWPLQVKRGNRSDKYDKWQSGKVGKIHGAMRFGRVWKLHLLKVWSCWSLNISNLQKQAATSTWDGLDLIFDLWLACWFRFRIFESVTGLVYAWGDNRNGQIGLEGGKKDWLWRHFSTAAAFFRIFEGKIWAHWCLLVHTTCLMNHAVFEGGVEKSNWCLAICKKSLEASQHRSWAKEAGVFFER